MTITAIEPYALPCANELPQRRLPWRADAARAVLLVHDMQRYFLRYYRPDQPPLPEALHNVQSLIAACRSRGVPVVYTAQPADPSRADRMLLGDLWGPGLTAFPDEADIASALAPAPRDLVLHKTRYSAFHKTELAAYMRERDRDQLWISGVYAHIGCMITAFDAFMHDVKPFLALDAVMDFSREYHDLAGRLVSERCGAVVASAELVRATRDAEPPDTAEPGRSSAEQASSEAATTERWRRVTDSELAQLVSLEDATPDAELRDLGLDSIRMMELVESLRARGVLIESVSLLECQTLAELYDVVDQAPKQASTSALAPQPRGCP